ncbi:MULTISPECIES: HipA family kinase [Acidiphilium]|uniref:HipA-like kinase domain-containing protein n=2 Tax=Acidiphilium TaxID=522 RepID=A5G182_ACICJ|nr:MULTISPECIES: HipA family kinase [Acidiphilium]ABQ31614.1 hypothetical protein Acry_2420 [Acidiphilium cryptum JF-5]
MPESGLTQVALEVGFATVLRGAKRFNDRNVSLTYRGQVQLEDGSTKNVILKDLGSKELSNELLSTVIAQLLGLPTPRVYLALVPDGVLPIVHAPQINGGGHVVFASVDVQVPNLTYQLHHLAGGMPALINEITAWQHLGQLYGFDTWTANVDRHTGNLLFDGKGEIWLIDHGYCYTGPSWQVDHLVPTGQYRNRLSEWLTQSLTDAQKHARAVEVDQFATQIAELNVAEVIARSRIRALLQQSDVDALEAFLAQRVVAMPRQAKNALGVLV